MHRVILQVPKGILTDHVNGDGLDNRRNSIRVCTAKQNNHNRRIASNNTSGFKGVSWNFAKKKWVSKITANGEGFYLGHFTCLVKAAKAYDIAAKEKFGKFAYLNCGD